MRRLALVLFAALLSLPVAAQVPYGHLVVTERDMTNGPGIRYLDPADGSVVTVHGNVPNITLTDVRTVTVDPVTPATVWANGGVGFTTANVYPIQPQGNVHGLISSFRPSWPGFAYPFRFLKAFGNDLFATVQGGSNNGAYRIDVQARTATLLPIPLPNFAGDLALLGSSLFVSSDSAPSKVFEYPLPSGPARELLPTTPFPTIKSLAVRNGRLVAGTIGGDVLDIDPQTGNWIVLQQTAAGAIVALAVHPVSGAIFAATAGAVFDASLPSQPLYTSANQISDLDIGVHPVASLLRFGVPCQDGAFTLAPAFSYQGEPSIGNSGYAFEALACGANNPAALILGLTRVDIPLDALGMLGCRLYFATPFLTLPTVASGAGVATTAFPIPSSSWLRGTSFLAQYAVLAAGANPANVLSSDAALSIVR